MIRLTDDISLVGGGPISGSGLTDGPDSHVYLLDGGTAVGLVDCGLGSADSVTRILARAEPQLSRTHDRSLFLTHGHSDHAGAAAAFQGKGFRVHASREVATMLATGDDIATGTAAGRGAGIYPADFRPTPCPVDMVVADDQVVTLGRLTVRAIATPGHAAGHTAYLVSGPAGTALLSGDTLFLFGRILLQPVPDCDLDAHVTSIRRLAGLSFEALLPGHGGFTLRGGGGHAGMALAAVDALRIPPNLV